MKLKIIHVVLFVSAIAVVGMIVYLTGSSSKADMKKPAGQPASKFRGEDGRYLPYGTNQEPSARSMAAAEAGLNAKAGKKSGAPARSATSYIGTAGKLRVMAVGKVKAADAPVTGLDGALTVKAVTRASAENSTGRMVVGLELANYGDATLVCPNSWLVESEGGLRKSLSLANGDVRVDPGTYAAIEVTLPAMKGRWRLGADYYVEDVVFDAKLKVQQSEFGNYVPDSFLSVQGKMIWAEWIME